MQLRGRPQVDAAGRRGIRAVRVGFDQGDSSMIVHSNAFVFCTLSIRVLVVGIAVIGIAIVVVVFDRSAIAIGNEGRGGESRVGRSGSQHRESVE